MYAINYGSRPPARYPREYRGASMGAISLPEMNQETIVKWIVVPGITVGALMVAARLFGRKKKRGKK